MAACPGEIVGLALTSIALLISVCLNILLYYLRRKEREIRAMDVSIYQDSFHSASHRSEEDEQLNQVNPIYGNICIDGGPLRQDEDYEHMTRQRPRPVEKVEPADISYASLDLTVNQKKKKRRKYQQKQNQAHQAQTHPAPVTQQGFEVALPSRSSSLVVSRSSIYLNSHQMALEAEELERGREWEREMERQNAYHRETEMMGLHDDFDHGLCHQEPCHDQDC